MPTVEITKPLLFIQAPLAGKCGFCAFGEAHEHCPSATLSGDRTSALKCTCGCPQSRQTKCFNCGLREDIPTEIDPQTWLCVDRDACEARIETRLSANPTIQMLRQIRVGLGMNPDQGGKARDPRPSKAPSTGKCLHCGEPTKGGKFLPGHDAAWISNLVKAATDDPAFNLEETRALIAAASAHLLAKFDKRVHA